MIQRVIALIQEKSVVANDDLKDATNATRGMREGLKRAAQEVLVDLKDEYRRLLATTASYVLVTGSDSEELTKLLGDESKAFSVEADQLYNNIVERIDSRAYLGQAASGSVFDILGSAIEMEMRDIGVSSYPVVRFKAEYSQIIADKRQFVQLVKRAINDCVGGEIVGINSINSILPEAIKRGHGETLTPILLRTNDSKLVATLANDLTRLSKKVFVVTVGKAPGAVKQLPNSISIKEASLEALEALLAGVRERSV